MFGQLSFQSNNLRLDRKHKTYLLKPRGRFIRSLENTRHIFQFHFGIASKKGWPNFVMHQVMDNTPLVLPTPIQEPLSLTNLQADETSTHNLTPPPSTPILMFTDIQRTTCNSLTSSQFFSMAAYSVYDATT